MTLRLDDPELYAHEVRKLAGRRTRDTFRSGVELTAPLLASRADELSRMLAREVSRGAYRFRALLPRAAMLNGKPRTIYGLDPLDGVVWGVLTRVLMATMEPRLGGHVYSYRKGYSQWTACRAFAAHMMEHRAARPDPRLRGLFVLRRDVRRYDETIPVTPESSLWSTLRELCGDDVRGFRGDLWAFVTEAFRPPIRQPDGSERPLERGVATGLPTQTIACNTYLLPLDRKLCALTGGFYARFGDDILFAHHDLDTARAARDTLEQGVRELGLAFNDSKSRDYWLTAPGRAHGAARDFASASRLSYLGFDVGFDGARLRSDKRRALWLAFVRRLSHTERLLDGASAHERASALCAVARTIFDRGSPLADRYAPWLAFDVMSRDDLLQLDHGIALHIAERVSGRRGVRAFRSCPPRVLYRRHGLPSLLRSWDHARRARELREP